MWECLCVVRGGEGSASCCASVGLPRKPKKCRVDHRVARRTGGAAAAERAAATPVRVVALFKQQGGLSHHCCMMMSSHARIYYRRCPPAAGRRRRSVVVVVLLAITICCCSSLQDSFNNDVSIASHRRPRLRQRPQRKKRPARAEETMPCPLLHAVFGFLFNSAFASASCAISSGDAYLP